MVAYINTTSELKTECDVCVTSSSAVQICSQLENDKILFIPDPNLGRYVAEKLPEKEFAFYKGGCPRHIVVSVKDVEKARKATPRGIASGTSGVPPGSSGKGGFCWFYYRHYGLCKEFRKKRIYHRNREQHCRTSAVCMSR